jgi:hypothetical protein
LDIELGDVANLDFEPHIEDPRRSTGQITPPLGAIYQHQSRLGPQDRQYQAR